MSHKYDILTDEPLKDISIDLLPVTITGSLEAQPPKPILLRLTLKTSQPPVVENLIQKR